MCNIALRRIRFGSGQCASWTWPANSRGGSALEPHRVKFVSGHTSGQKKDKEEAAMVIDTLYHRRYF